MSIRKSVMQSSTVRLAAVLAGALLLSACGGGGGGGGASEDSSSSTGVRVLHAAIDAAPVDVIVTGNPVPVARRAVFALDNKYHALPSGPLNLQLTRTATPGTIIDSFAVTADSQSKFSILLYGDNSTFGLRTALLTDETPAESSSAHIRVVDGVTGAAAISVNISSPRGGENVEVAFGQASEYVAVPLGPITIRAARTADGRTISSRSVTLESSKAYTYLVAGEVDYFVKGVLLSDN
jgi:hypothetical protein